MRGAQKPLHLPKKFLLFANLAPKQSDGFSGGPAFEELSSLVYPNLTTSTLKLEVGPRHPGGVQFVVATI